ncbi:hypothetical protein, partial [Enterococcus faecalis]|uniref:hypothetical protein n=1 Tax=Enterococcus faecalis TaxID=1351 RepID=UPI0015CE8C15
TNIPFQSLKDFQDTMARLGLELINEETKTSTNSPIGSQHWFTTLVSGAIHVGSFLENQKDIIDLKTLNEWGKSLKESGQELVRGFKFINKQD